MQRFFLAFMLAAWAFLPAPAQAVELDSPTELLLRCGSGYVFLSAAPGGTGSAEEAAKLRSLGEALMMRADDNLARLGVSVSEREKIGERIGTEVAMAFVNDSDPGFTVEQCTSLVFADDPEAAAAATARTNEIEKLMTCGAIFDLVAQTAKEEEDAGKASEYEDLKNKLFSRADELMVESGMDKPSRDQTSQLYVEQVVQSIKAGQDLTYDWETCAAIGG